MKKTFLLLLAMIGISLSPLVMPEITYAVTCNGVQTSIDYGCQKIAGSGAQASPIFSLLIVVINFLAIGVGIVVVGGIVWGAIQFISSNGNAQKTQQGVSYIVNSVIGLLLFIFMYALINFLIPGGLFN